MRESLRHWQEATTHGSLPWTAEHERRSLIVRYAPGNLAAAGPDWKWPDQDWPAEFLDGMTPEQLTVMERPYHSERADIGRPWLDDDGGLVRDRKRAML